MCRPGSQTAAAGGVGPEFQITTETSVAGYLNYMQSVIQSGVGTSPLQGVRDIEADYSAEVALADNPDALLDRLDLLLTHGQMTAATRRQIRDAVAVQSRSPRPMAGSTEPSSPSS